MKNKILFIGLSLALCTTIVNGQIKVSTTGKVGVGLPSTSTPLSAFSINSTGSSRTTAVISSPDMAYGLSVSRSGVCPSGGQPWVYGINASSAIQDSSIEVSFGISASSTAPSALTYGKAIAVYGYAGGAQTGYNYGVLGTLQKRGSEYGAAIVGTTSYGTFPYIGGTYAGYFSGNVQITGLLNGKAITCSDIRFKENITEIGQNDLILKSGFTRISTTPTLDKLLTLQAIEYNYKQVYFDTDETKSLEERGFFDEKSGILDKKHFGFIAQDVQGVYPDLVYEAENGYLSVSYVDMIPLLQQSLRELTQRMDALTTENQRLLVAAQSKNSISDEMFSIAESESISKSAVLYQNIPNPFSQSTQIKYYLPGNVSTALLCFYDLQGKQLKQVKLNERGENYQIISGSEFSAGIYLYALIADGKEVDVKRMILTE